jgi:hypothetical protein
MLGYYFETRYGPIHRYLFKDVWKGVYSISIQSKIIFTAESAVENSTIIHRGTCKIYPDDGGAKFLRNVGSYKSHTA